MFSRAPSALPGQPRDRPSASLVIWLLAATYLAAHVPFLPSTPYDIDGVNFALGLHEYDLAKHQPHPPGAPLFVGLGRVARTTMEWAQGSQVGALPERALDVAALAIWSACFGTVAVFGFFRLFTAIGLSAAGAAWATALAVTTPLFWFSGVRPMSDLPGLAIAGLAIGLMAPRLTGRPQGSLLLLGCFFAGLAPGVRVQMAWLAWPTLLVALALESRRDPRRALAAAAAWLVGLLVWIVPLGVIAGGPAEYVRLLRLQAFEDVAGGQMLWADASLSAVAHALYDSLVAPWGEAWLGWVAVAAASVGGAHLLWAQTRVALCLILFFGPYALLHLGFHDTTHIRYSLPLVPLVAVLATNGWRVLGRRVGTVGALAMIVASTWVGARAVLAQSGRPAPVYQALDAVREGLARIPEARPVLAMHHSVGLALRREDLPTRVLPSPLQYEWLQLADYWRDGNTAPVWFLASRRRTDLALVDPSARSVMASYRLPEASGALLAGARPRSIEWLEFRPPGWVALEGWSLTPEVRGVTVREYQRNRVPTTRAIVRRRSSEVAIVLGGRNLGGPCATAATVRVLVDGRTVHTFATRAGQSFVELWRLPAGALDGSGTFADLEVRADDPTGAGRLVDVAFEQFDVQSAEHPVAALAEGWFEPEYDTRAGTGFRWMSDRATLRVDAFNRDVTLHLAGESPRRNFRQASDLVVTVGRTIIGRYRLQDDFDLPLTLPAAVLQQAGGRVDLEVSQAFVPDDHTGNGDRRALALKILDVRVRPGSAGIRASVQTAPGEARP